MTTVAAIADVSAGWVVMAADTASAYQGTIITGARKIRRLRTSNDVDYLLAAAGNGSLAQVPSRALTVPSTPDAAGPDEAWDLWAEAIASAVTEIAADTSPPITMPHPDGSTVLDGALLLGCAGRLWYLFTHQALRISEGLAALGSGADIAFGVLACARVLAVVEPVAQVGLALQIACKYDAWTGVGPLGAQVERVAL